MSKRCGQVTDQQAGPDVDAGLSELFHEVLPARVVCHSVAVVTLVSQRHWLEQQTPSVDILRVFIEERSLTLYYKNVLLCLTFDTFI